MMPIIPHRKAFLSISLMFVLLSYGALWRWGLKLGIDYTGGALSEIQFTGTTPPLPADLQKKLIAEGFEISSAQRSEGNSYLLRMKSLDEAEHQRYLAVLTSSFAKQAGVEGNALPVPSDSAWIENRFESVGPTIGVELRQKSLWALIVALIAIVLYIAYAFRKVSRPVASWKYGVCAILALVHDISIPTGFMAFMGHSYGWEADLLFVTALLTILGFSVHDTIVVYDRIRENLLKSGGRNYEEIANASVNQTLARSINTSLTTIIVLVALTLFGGESTKHFTIILMLGIFFGTYSSIFIASPLVVIWNRWGKRT